MDEKINFELKILKLEMLSGSVITTRSVSPPRRKASLTGSQKSSRVGSPFRQPKPEEPHLGSKGSNHHLKTFNYFINKNHCLNQHQHKAQHWPLQK